MKKSDCEISLLVAYTKNGRVIGSGGKIPWNIPSERNRFKRLCQNKDVLMGRKTFEEIGHALPYCTIVIISKTMKECPDGCKLAASFEEGIKLCSQNEILVAGGQELYEQAMLDAQTRRIYATEVELEVAGDRFFPELGIEWKKAALETAENKSTHTENGISFEYVTFTR